MSVVRPNENLNLDVVIQPQPKQDEIGALLQMLKRNTFSEKSVIIADKGYESYNVIAHFLAESGEYETLATNLPRGLYAGGYKGTVPYAVGHRDIVPCLKV